LEVVMDDIPALWTPQVSGGRPCSGSKAVPHPWLCWRRPALTGPRSYRDWIAKVCLADHVRRGDRHIQPSLAPSSQLPSIPHSGLGDRLLALAPHAIKVSPARARPSWRFWWSS